MKKQNVRTLSLIVCTLTYLLIGASIFDALESEEEQRQKEALESYGHSTPKTDGGKLFTMVYAMIGIPLGLVMFNSIGERLNNFSSIVINKIRRGLNAKQSETTEMDLISVVTTLSIIVVTAGAAAFSHYEGWSYFHSIYYCFTTLTTIGFGDYVALQQDSSLGNKPEYVAFALFFIMFGLAIIAASLNLMVLKFMTMNTEDEKRDEQQAIQAAALDVRLDGDIILQQSEVLHWQAEGAGSLEEIRSVCSCTCNSCNPFQQINHRYQEDHFTRLATTPSADRGKKKTKTKWMRRKQKYTNGGSNWNSQISMLTHSDREQGGGTPTTTIDECCDYKERLRRSKADSVHDLRRSTVSSVLRLPPCTPPHLKRPMSRAKSCCAAAASGRMASQCRLSEGGGSRSDLFSSVRQFNELGGRVQRGRKPGNKRFLNRFFLWNIADGSNSRTFLEVDDEETERRESYALDEVDSIKVVPLAKNANYQKRVSL
eukprot:maker-scaffold233_size243130-snap-gene-0.12 protein:Tk00486 transcript:maker-scaffold233_size243130-snap-gene-0.12-mRNA-1 annotation:"two pore potassium channel protein sup-9"